MEALLLISVFITVFLFLLAFSNLRGSKKEDESVVQKSLSISELLKNANQRLKMLLIQKKKPSKKRNTLEDRLSVAGLPIKPEEFVAFRWLLAVISGGILQLNSNILLGIIGVVFGYFIPEVWLKSKQRKRIKAFNEGLPGMITSIIGSLRAGFSFVQSLQMVSQESYSPIKEEVEHIIKSMQYGTSMEDALLEWQKRMPSDDLGLLVDAILIQRQVGGNLAYLLDKIVETTRERTKIENQIKTLTAQGRLSGIVISLLPVALGFIIYLMNPGYITTLFVNPIGQLMLGAALVGGIIGFFLIRKITTIEV
ncbi:type II secretion system F family protein [Virgibacillus litoralis]|uniref:Tight adherence protein B n=1 Tax=Virgibacillus litoralis TaxID=578221 RepID=A0ABS4HC39_9BACI|nr:type II secretion system F family protein [Virgibacillus litoralis]MBP1948062.1 tight adherence protein B [Virgibacillus litoralis]